MSDIESWWSKNGMTVKRNQAGGTLSVLPTVLTTLQNQLQQNVPQKPDPTMGAPFASRIPSSDWSTVAQMGPGQPATPFPIGGEPRQWVYRVGWNFPTPPDSDRRIDGQLLRQLADSSFLIRRAIEIRKAELISMEWDIVTSTDALSDPQYGDTQRERQKNLSTKNRELQKQIKEFFTYPEAYYSARSDGTWIRKGEVEWADWLNACAEDYFVGDWLTLWPQKTLGGELLSMRRVDGEHTKVLLGLDGRLPAPPLPAYQQYLYGVPRANFTQDDLYFWPRNLRNITPYGFSHIEQMLVLILLIMRYDQTNLAAYNETTLPMGILETPAGISPDQIRDVADFLNGAVANIPDRFKVYPAPAGTKWQPIKPYNYDHNFANYLIDLACVGMDVTRQEMGFAPSNTGGLGGSGHADAQSDLEKRKGRVPLAKWFEGKMNRIIRDHFGTNELEFRFTELITEDLNSKYEANEKAIRSGQISLDQVLEDLGQQGIGMGHMIETTSGVLIPERGILITSQGALPMYSAAPQKQQDASAKPTGDPEQDAHQASVEHAAKQRAAESSKSASLILSTLDREDDRRKKQEEAFVILWLLFMRKKIKDAVDERPLYPSKVRSSFMLDQADRDAIAQMLLDARAEAYWSTLDAMPDPTFGSEHIDPQDAIKRLTVSTLQHAEGIANTWDSDVSAVADRIEASGADAREMLEQMAEWAGDRLEWKGKQIGITEITDAQGQAQQDWSSNHQAQSVGYMRWVSKMDGKTCWECKVKHGRLVDPRYDKPPQHPNCRCELVPPGTIIPHAQRQIDEHERIQRRNLEVNP